MIEWPLALVLLLLPASLLGRWLRRRGTTPAGVECATWECAEHSPRTWRERADTVAVGLRVAALALACVASAGVWMRTTHRVVSQPGVDVVFVIDVSPSMLAEDLSPNRLGAAKQFAEALVERRPGDRFGVVAFSVRAATVCPVTHDRDAVRQALRQLEPLEGDEGTALGQAIAHASRRLAVSPGSNRLVIVLSDGGNNVGEPTPAEAAAVARHYGIQVYAVGTGSRGLVPYPTEVGPISVRLPLEDRVLRDLANLSDGRYFDLTAPTSPVDVAAALGRLEPSAALATTLERRQNRAPWLIAMACACLLLESAVAVWRRREA